MSFFRGSLAVLAIVLVLIVVTRTSEAVRLSFLTVAAEGGSDLLVIKTGPDMATADSNVTFTVNVTNLGPDPAPIVTLTDVIPNSLTFVSVEETSADPDLFSCGAPTSGPTSRTVTCTTTNFPAGVSREFTVIVNVPAGTPPGFYTNVASARITSSPPPGPDDPPLEVDEENNTSSATFTIPGATSADLSATKTSPENVTPGSDVPFSIVISNFGPDAAASVSFSDTVPGNMTFVSMMQHSGPAFNCTSPAPGSGGTVTCTLATMAAGASATFTLTTNVPAGSFGVEYNNSVTVSSTTSDPNGINNTGLATVRASSADISVTKVGTAASATAGGTISWTINLTNGGPSTATSPSFVDQLPAGTTFAMLTQNNGPTFSCNTPEVGQNGTVTCSSVALGSGGSAEFTLTANVLSNVPNGSVISNTATSSSEDADPNTANNSQTAMTTINTSADVAITKTAAPEPVTAGSNLTYTITVTNNGVSDASSLELLDSLPPGTSLVSFSTPAGWTRTDAVPVGGTGTVSATASTLAAGASSQFTLVVKVDSNTSAGTQLNNSAAVTSITFDPNEGNNSQSAATTINTSADVGVTKTDSPDPVVAGSNLTYTINVTNTGPSDAGSLELTDLLPPGTTFVSFAVPAGWTRTDAVPVGSTGTVSATAPALTAGAGAIFTLVVNVNSSTVNNTTITNSATVSSATADPNGNNNTGTATTTVTNQADLQLTKSDAPDPVLAGNNITYTINFKNNGPVTANSVTVTDGVPANTTFVSAAVTTGSGWGAATPPAGGTGNVVFSKASVANQETAEFTIVVNVNSETPNGTVVSNTTVAASTTEDPNGNNNSATATTGVGSFPDLTITKGHTGNFSQGQTGASYTIRVTNSSTGPTSGLVTVTDNVPAGLTPTGPTGVVDGWTCSINGQTLTCTRADVLVGGASYPDIILTVNVANPGPISVTNTATVSGGGELNLSNNSASDPTIIDCSQDAGLNNPSPLMISRFRENGPGGATDEFVEIFNPTTTAHRVASGTCTGGYGVFASAGNGTASNSATMVCQIANGTVIPAGGYYLCAGTGYTLGNLGRNGGTAGATATGDSAIGCGGLIGGCAGDIPNDAGLALINIGTNVVINTAGGFAVSGVPASAVIVYDKVGFGPYGPGAPGSAYPSLAGNFCEGGACLRPVGDASLLGTCTDPSGAGLFPVLAAAPACYGQSGQYGLLRRQTTFDPNLGTLHQDSNNGGNDFIFVSPNPGSNTGLTITGVSGVTAVLGAAGPYNLSAPPDAASTKLTRSPFDGFDQLGPRNAERSYVQDPNVANPLNDPLGTFTLRFKYTNNAGVAINGLRFQVDNLSTLCGGQTANPALGTGDARNLTGAPDCGPGSLTSILKAINSTAEVLVDSGGTAQTVNGTVLEDLSATGGPPPAPGPLSPLGGGIDNTLVVNPSTAGASVGDDVTGGTGNFATSMATSGATKELRVKVKFGVVRSGRFLLLLIPMAKTSP